MKINRQKQTLHPLLSDTSVGTHKEGKSKSREFKSPVELKLEKPKPLNFLVVDDVLIHRRQLKYMLRKLFPTSKCDVVESGEQAITLAEALRKRDILYDLVFMDQDMGGSTIQQLQGDETVKELRKRDFTFPVIMRTTTCDVESLALYTKAGANAVFLKNTPLKKMKIIITSIINKKRRLITRDAETKFFYLEPAENLSNLSPCTWSSSAIDYTMFSSPSSQPSKDPIEAMSAPPPQETLNRRMRIHLATENSLPETPGRFEESLKRLSQFMAVRKKKQQ